MTIFRNLFLIRQRGGGLKNPENVLTQQLYEWSPSHNVNVMPTTISQTLEEKKEESEKQTLEPDADQKAEEVLGKGEGTVEEVAEDVKVAEFNVTTDSTTTEKEPTETEPSDIVEEGED